MRKILLTLALAASLASTVAIAEPADYADQARKTVQAYVQADRFSGAVLVAKGDRVVLREGFGLANREWDIPATPQTVFRLGSLTKQFTAAAILQLSEQGKLGLDDPISKFYPAPPAWSQITLRHLLTHTSGIPSYTNIPGFFDVAARADLTPEQIVALTRDKPLEFKPGSRFNYDNTGYVLLGYVIEKVSGQTYKAYVEDHIFKPLGLVHSGYDVTADILPRRAAGYSVSAGKATNTPYLSMTLPYAAGSLYSTVDDLLAWELALQGGKVIKPASLKAMFTDYGAKYGFGQAISALGTHRLWTHSGGINGFATVLGRYPDDDLTVIVLSNVQEAPVGKIGAELAALYLGVTIPAKAAPTIVKLESSVLARYEGRYRLSPAMTLTVVAEGDHLVVQVTGQPPFAARPTGERDFYIEAPEARLTFNGPVGGKADEVVIHQGGADTPAKRIETP